jgi:hypothetical protein
MKFFLGMFFSLGFLVILSQDEISKVEWIGKRNRLENPGAESISGNFPISWKTNFIDSGESDFWSTYGVTSHEWNSNEEIIGLPQNAGSNYFRIMVNRTYEKRESNLYQIINIDDLSNQDGEYKFIAVLSGNIAANYYTKTNCAIAELKMLFLNSEGIAIDSLKIEKKAQEFRDLDANSELSLERGFSVMHEFIPVQEMMQIPMDSKKIKVELYCYFPCNLNQESVHEEENFNVFYFDNIALGFFRKLNK